MQDHSIPVIFQELSRDISRHILIDFGEVLCKSFQFISFLLCTVVTAEALTETKKLVVPSILENRFGNSLIHVSSPNMLTFPPG